MTAHDWIVLALFLEGAWATWYFMRKTDPSTAKERDVKELDGSYLDECAALGPNHTECVGVEGHSGDHHTNARGERWRACPECLRRVGAHHKMSCGTQAFKPEWVVGPGLVC